MRDTVVRKRKYRYAKLEISRVALLRRTWHGIALDYGEKSGVRKYRIELSDKVLKWAATSPYSDWINLFAGDACEEIRFSRPDVADDRNARRVQYRIGLRQGRPKARQENGRGCRPA
jgi:hypothetical protein